MCNVTIYRNTGRKTGAEEVERVRETSSYRGREFGGRIYAPEVRVFEDDWSRVENV